MNQHHKTLISDFKHFQGQCVNFKKNGKKWNLKITGLGPFYSGGLADLDLFNSKLATGSFSKKKITNTFDK